MINKLIIIWYLEILNFCISNLAKTVLQISKNIIETFAIHLNKKTVISDHKKTVIIALLSDLKLFPKIIIKIISGIDNPIIISRMIKTAIKCINKKNVSFLIVKP